MKAILDTLKFWGVMFLLSATIGVVVTLSCAFLYSAIGSALRP